MKKRIASIALILAGLALPIASAWALRAAPPPGPVRIVGSDAVFIGKVTGFEPIDVEAKQYPAAKTTVKYRIAIVKVNEVIRGLKGEKTLRVGFIPPMQPKPNPGRPISSGGGFRGPTLTAGQEGLFMIKKHADGKFYQAPDFGYFVPSQQKDFKEEVNQAKKVVAILADTTAALKSKDADDRLLAASVVISKYRTPNGRGPFREEPIAADESKLILNALANAKWQPVVKYGDPNPYQLFSQLGIRAQDGWKAPTKIRNQDDLRDAVQAWIRQHGDTYRVKRFVAGAADR